MLHSCLHISVLKCEMRKPDGITDDGFVLRGYSKWMDRSIDKRGIEYYILLTSVAQLETTGLCYLDILSY